MKKDKPERKVAANPARGIVATTLPAKMERTEFLKRLMAIPTPDRDMGGGGAAAVGGNGVTSTGGTGGAGRATSITGTSVTYAGGGGGSGDTPGSGGTGGGGGGAGGSATAGTANRGGGGGGFYYGASGTSQSGGSGIVILRYLTAEGTITIGAGLTGSTATDGSYKVTTITAGTGTVSWA